jgi:hypothetical protein
MGFAAGGTIRFRRERRLLYGDLRALAGWHAAGFEGYSFMRLFDNIHKALPLIRSHALTVSAWPHDEVQVFSRGRAAGRRWVVFHC